MSLQLKQPLNGPQTGETGKKILMNDASGKSAGNTNMTTMNSNDMTTTSTLDSSAQSFH